MVDGARAVFVVVRRWVPCGAPALPARSQVRAGHVRSLQCTQVPNLAHVADQCYMEREKTCSGDS